MLGFMLVPEVQPTADNSEAEVLKLRKIPARMLLLTRV